MQPKTAAQRVRGLGFLAAVIAIVILVVCGPGHRLGILDVKIAMLGSALAAVIAAIALLLTMLSFVLPNKGNHDNKMLRTVGTLVVTGAIVYQMGNALMTGRSVPQIHDITTDTQDPPAFIALLSARAGAANPAEYAGEAASKLQRAAYPDLQTIRLANTQPNIAIAAAATVAETMGWGDIRSLPEDGRLEATDTTFWYGFKDDIVVRARENGDGTLLDVRSKSRVGKSDLGTNAKRIREFREAIEQMLQ